MKDLYDVAGVVTSYGNPDWARTHPPATGTAICVRALLEAGADMKGKTKTVELAYGLTGENVWHGTPTNPNAPDRFPAAPPVLGGGRRRADGGFRHGVGHRRLRPHPGSYCGTFGIRPGARSA